MRRAPCLRGCGRERRRPLARRWRTPHRSAGARCNHAPLLVDEVGLGGARAAEGVVELVVHVANAGVGQPHSRTFSRLSLEASTWVTPSTLASPVRCSARCIAERIGASASHGAHQEPHTFTTRIEPRRSLRLVVPGRPRFWSSSVAAGAAGRSPRCNGRIEIGRAAARDQAIGQQAHHRTASVTTATGTGERRIHRAA